MIFDNFQEMTSSTCSTHFKFFDAPSRKPSQTRTKIKSFSSQISTFSCPLTLISLLCVLSTFQCSPAIIKENTSPSENTNNNLNISKSSNMTHNMEVLVIVDETMTRVHGSNLTGYIHTLMNIVDEIFHHETLGISINIVLSKTLIYRPPQHQRSVIYYNDPTKTLKQLMPYFRTLKKSNSFDLGIFLTRDYFGASEGYALMEGMCTLDRAGVIVRDKGFKSAFVIAQLIGHALGLNSLGKKHLDKPKNACINTPDTGSIMSEVMFSKIWSACSKQELAANINKFSCLSDAPTKQDPQIQFKKDNNLITIDGQRYDGQLWDRDSQCRASHGPNFSWCMNLRRGELDQECKTVRCVRSSESATSDHAHCLGIGEGILTGTPCGNHDEQWCVNGSCVWKSPKCINSVFCTVDFCELKLYREVCCKTCENWQPENAKTTIEDEMTTDQPTNLYTGTTWAPWDYDYLDQDYLDDSPEFRPVPLSQ